MFIQWHEFNFWFLFFCSDFRNFRSELNINLNSDFLIKYFYWEFEFKTFWIFYLFANRVKNILFFSGSFKFFKNFMSFQAKIFDLESKLFQVSNWFKRSSEITWKLEIFWNNDFGKLKFWTQTQNQSLYLLIKLQRTALLTKKTKLLLSLSTNFKHLQY